MEVSLMFGGSRFLARSAPEEVTLRHTVAVNTMLPLLLSSLLALQTAASLEVHTPDLPVVALYGRDMVLNCSFTGEKASSLTQLSIFWQLTDTKRAVHSFTDGRDLLTDQSAAFANRTSLFPRELLAGNSSLLLRQVRVADEGSYTCFVRVQQYSSAAMLLQVAAPYSKPVVTLSPDSNLRPGDKVALTCVAYGGYPEAELLWQDGSGRNLTDNVTTSQVANDEGLFSVRSVAMVTLEPNSTYSCRVTNPLLGDEGHASVSITGQNAVFPPVALWVTVGLAVCLLALLIALAVVCRRKIKESCEEMKAEEEAKELEEECKTAMTPLKS
ncbi:CD276 antigen [Denticeps clupeoides]|uniref:Ig-like domain-containing protein n=1 Tax=Denticeps clupeoides TaxID=299321 RepID=A0AAY4CF24_9TELE|nr:CD276 antigen-like [Denticeps clupeoides]XP_028812933.1 CD276 antigen-like [Denticeps clupeoides]